MDINGNPKCSYFAIMDYHKNTELNPSGAPAISSLSSVARIEDHQTEVLSCGFHPSGQFLLSTNDGGEIHVCSIDNKSTNMILMKGHKGPVKEAHFSRDGFNIYSCSVDNTVGIWDAFKGFRIRTLMGHTSDVNCVQGARIGYPVLCSGSNDGTVRIWDAREYDCAMSLNNQAQVNAVCFSDNGEYAFSGGADKDIKIWDLRTTEVISRLQGHANTVTGLSLSPCGSYLLSKSADSTLRIWNVRAYAPANRFIGCFPSNQSPNDGLMRCAWSADGGLISAGTSDRVVCVWDAMSGVKLFELPRHGHRINDVAFHPNELTMLTASNKQLSIFELSK